MATILLDMDGPLADFDQAFWDRCRAQGWVFDIDHPDQQRHRFFTDHMPVRFERKAARAMVDAAGWFCDLPVTPGAQEGVAELLEAGHDLWVCTKPLEANPTCLNDKHAWLVDHFPELSDRLITAPDKSMIRGDILLDDAPKPEWFPHAAWRPVIFGAPFNYGDENYAGLPIWTWGSRIEALVDAASPFLTPAQAAELVESGEGYQCYRTWQNDWNATGGNTAEELRAMPDQHVPRPLWRRKPSTDA